MPFRDFCTTSRKSSPAPRSINGMAPELTRSTFALIDVQQVNLQPGFARQYDAQRESNMPAAANNHNLL